MSSNINPLNINGAFPIAGQDNDSQGFRDNFTNIRTNLTFTKEEIEDLQSKVVLKSPLNGQTATSNNFAGTQMTGAQIKSFTEVASDQGVKSGSVVVDFASGHMHKLETNGPITFNIAWTGLSGGAYAKMRLWVKVDSVTHTLSFPSTVTIGLSKIIGGSGYTFVPVVGTYIFELSTLDAGTNTIIIPLLTP